MSTIAKSARFLRLVLVAPCQSLELAAPTVARHLNVAPGEAVSRLSVAPSILSECVEFNAAKHLVSLLAVLGVNVRLDPVGLDPIEQRLTTRFDLSIQPAGPGDPEGLAKGLARCLPAHLLTGPDREPNRIAAALGSAGGVILKNLTDAEVTQTRRALRRNRGFLIIQSNPETAQYDLMMTAPSPLPASLQHYFKRLGLAPCALSGAVAAQLDKAMRNHVLTRFPDLGLTALNRDFQRFDLFLAGAHNVLPRDLTDFLALRSDLGRTTRQHMPEAVKLDSGLTRAVALAFQADYATLGLETSVKLRVFHPVHIPSEDRVAP